MSRIDHFCLWMLDREWAQWIAAAVIVGIGAVLFLLLLG